MPKNIFHPKYSLTQNFSSVICKLFSLVCYLFLYSLAAFLLYFVLLFICLSICEQIYPTIDGEIQITSLSGLIFLLIAPMLPPAYVLWRGWKKIKQRSKKKSIPDFTAPISPQNLQNIEASLQEHLLALNTPAPFAPPIPSLDLVGITANLDFSNADAMAVIKALEHNLDTVYHKSLTNSFLPVSVTNLRRFKQICDSSILPLAAEMRLESLYNEYVQKFEAIDKLSIVDQMNGSEFEEWCANLLRQNGYVDVQLTPYRGDQGVDILATKENLHYAIQCKCYNKNLGNQPIQEVNAGKTLYHCHVGVVMTNRYFTPDGKKLAEALGIALWDRKTLYMLISEASKIND